MDDARAAFLAAADAGSHGPPALQAARALIGEMLARQISDDDPTEVWRTARRLLDAGLDQAAVQTQLRLALAAFLRPSTDGSVALDRDGYLAALAGLPLPTGEEIEEHVVDVVRERQPVDADDVDRLVSERLGATPDDPLVEQLLDRVTDDLLRDDGSPVAIVAPDLLVHVPTLLGGVVLTHRLTDDERKSGVLLAVDLPGFARKELRHCGEAIHDYVGDDGLPRWLGPRDWLAPFPAGSLLTVRAQADGEIALAALRPDPTAPDELVSTVRAAYDTEVEEPWLPVTAEDLLLATLVRDPGAFARPVPPLTELAVAAGLEVRGACVAHEESVWRQAASADRHYRIIHRLGTGPEVSAAVQALDLLDEGIPDRAAAHAVLQSLHSLPVLEVVVDELLGTPDDPDRAGQLAAHAERLLALTSRPAEQAVARWLAAAAAERLGAAQDAETKLRAAARDDPGWPAAEDRLAWYESDRGDAVAAAARLRRLGFSRQDSPDLAVLERFAEAPVERSLGRNEPCWCGSGRKYKVCHLNRPEQPSLPDRVGWLYRKAVAYLERRGGDARSIVFDHALALASADADAIDDALDDPLVSDTVLHEGGWWQKFLDDRGRLLPDDEALLAAAWALAERTVCEVLDVVPGRGLTVRDLRTGERLDVRERTFSHTARIGTLVCARIVPDGETHQFIGGLFPVAPGTESALLELLDQHDGLALLEYVADVRRPPRLVTTEGEPVLDCRAELRVPDRSSARSVLDHRYERDDDGWVSFATPEEGAATAASRTVLAWLRLEDDTLTVRTLSAARLDACLADIRSDLPAARLVLDERGPIESAAIPRPTSESPSVPDEILLEWLDEQERAWCKERVPALGGRTPQEAAADPTRRGELSRLIAGFPVTDPASGVVCLRPHRLRELLGLRAVL